MGKTEYVVIDLSYFVNVTKRKSFTETKTLFFRRYLMGICSSIVNIQDTSHHFSTISYGVLKCCLQCNIPEHFLFLAVY